MAPVLVMERLPPLQSTQPVLELMVVLELTAVHAMAGAAASVSARIDTPVINLWLKVRHQAPLTMASRPKCRLRPGAPTYRLSAIFQKLVKVPLIKPGREVPKTEANAGLYTPLSAALADRLRI
jgi:hypothetical protein